jgi:hypothetical protein
MQDPQKPHAEKPNSSKAADEKPDSKAAPKKPFVFKIVPADPKNAFNFEDVADK